MISSWQWRPGWGHTLKKGVEVCAALKTLFTSSWSFAKTSFQHFLILKTLLSHPLKLQISGNLSSSASKLAKRTFSSKASNWAKVQLTWLDFLKFGSLRVPNSAQGSLFFVLWASHYTQVKVGCPWECDTPPWRQCFLWLFCVVTKTFLYVYTYAI